MILNIITRLFRTLILSMLCISVACASNKNLNTQVGTSEKNKVNHQKQNTRAVQSSTKKHVSLNNDKLITVVGAGALVLLCGVALALVGSGGGSRSKTDRTSFDLPSSSRFSSSHFSHSSDSSSFRSLPSFNPPSFSGGTGGSGRPAPAAPQGVAFA